MIGVRRDGDVFVVEMDGGENRLNNGFLESFNAALDEVEAHAGPAALVTTAFGKYWSTGLDLEWIAATEDDVHEFFVGVHGLLARMLAFPMVTVAALNGHTFAAGTMLALAHDFEVMREDRGFWCLPEAEIGIPLSPGMNALVLSRLDHRLAHEVLVTATRYGGFDAAQRGLVDHAVHEADVVSRAVAIASGHVDKDRSTMRTIKERMHAGTLELLRNGDNVDLDAVKAR